MPCPHCEITIIQRSNNESAASAAAYQSGERLFSEYDQKQKYYPYKNEIVHKEIMLVSHVPPEFADRNTLRTQPKRRKSSEPQLARRFVLAIQGEILPDSSMPTLSGTTAGSFLFQRHGLPTLPSMTRGTATHTPTSCSPHAGDGRNWEMAPQEPEGVRP